MKREIKVNIDITSRLQINKLFAVVADGLCWMLGAGGARCSGQCKLPEAAQKSTTLAGKGTTQ